MTVIRIPWRAWYGDETLELTFPAGWRVQVYWPADASTIRPEAIEQALAHPIGSPPLEELARGKRTVSIAVDDISRPTPAAPLMPALMRCLEQGGIDLDRVRVVLGVGMHRAMVKEDIIKKIGQAAADRLDVHNNNPYENTVDLGTTPRGTPVRICRFFAEADLKIGVGGITPHGSPGFGGGAKVITPGVAGVETIASIHEPGRLQTGLGLEENEFRREIEYIAREHVRLDFLINVVPNTRREIAGVFAGDLVAAHRAGVRLARQVFATRMPVEPVDVAITNAYPKDTDFLQNSLSLNVLRSAKGTVVKEGGVVVVITASPEGRGYHGIYGPGMRYGPELPAPDHPHTPRFGEAEVIYFSPGVTAADVRWASLFRRWENLIAHLETRFAGRVPSVAVFPCGAMQLAA